MKILEISQETYRNGAVVAFGKEVDAAGMPTIIGSINGLPKVTIADQITGAITVELCKEYLRISKGICPDVNRIEIIIGGKVADAVYKYAMYKEAGNHLVIKVNGRFVYENRDGRICTDPDAWYCG